MPKVKNPRVPRTRANGTKTEAGYFGYIRSTLRRGWLKYPVRYAALKAASRTVRGKRHKTEYQCNCCEKWFKGSEVEVDHLVPAGSLKSFDDLPRFVENLFCELDGVQVVCKPCHQDITNEQRARGWK